MCVGKSESVGCTSYRCGSLQTDAPSSAMPGQSAEERDETSCECSTTLLSVLLVSCLCCVDVQYVCVCVCVCVCVYSVILQQSALHPFQHLTMK